MRLSMAWVTATGSTRTRQGCNSASIAAFGERSVRRSTIASVSRSSRTSSRSGADSVYRARFSKPDQIGQLPGLLPCRAYQGRACGSATPSPSWGSSRLVVKLVSGVRNSWDASATSWRCAVIASWSVANIRSNEAPSRRFVRPGHPEPSREIAGVGHVFGGRGQVGDGSQDTAGCQVGETGLRAPAATVSTASKRRPGRVRRCPRGQHGWFGRGLRPRCPASRPCTRGIDGRRR